jgi:hypothetical protein
MRSDLNSGRRTAGVEQRASNSGRLRETALSYTHLNMRMHVCLLGESTKNHITKEGGS